MIRIRTLCRCFLTGLLLVLGQEVMAARPHVKDFEQQAFDRMSDLVYNHTYDLDNVVVADSIYAAAESLASVRGKMYALRIKLYAQVGDNESMDFLKTAQAYIALAEEGGYKDEYFEGISTKIQYLLMKEEYVESMVLAKEMLKRATESDYIQGLYESYLLLGEIFKCRSNFVVAISYLQKSLSCTTDQDSVGRSIIFRNLAENYSALGQYRKGQEYSRLARTWAPFDTYRRLAEYTLLASLFYGYSLDEFRSEYQTSPLSQTDMSTFLSDDMQTIMNCMVLIANGQYEEGRRQAQNIANRQELINIIALSLYYEGDYKGAYHKLEELTISRDSIMAGIQGSELTYFDAELGNAVLRIEAEKARSNQLLITELSIAVILLLIILGLIHGLRRRKRENARLRASQQETANALVKAEAASAMRIHFIQNMSHEIRTPLNAIYGFSQILCDPSLSSDEVTRNELMLRIGENTNHLTRLLDNIITISDYDAGNVPCLKQEVLLKDVLRQVVDSFPQKKDVDLQLEDCGELTLLTNAKQLLKAIQLLVDNALKFTDKGYVRLSATREGQHVLIRVEDTGRGVGEADVDRLFDRFFKADNFMPGVGFGLPLCRCIVNNMGASVEYDRTYAQHDTDTQGSRFIIRIPN